MVNKNNGRLLGGWFKMSIIFIFKYCGTENVNIKSMVKTQELLFVQAIYYGFDTANTSFFLNTCLEFLQFRIWGVWI